MSKFITENGNINVWRVFFLEFNENRNGFIARELCDNYFYGAITPDELLEIANRMIEMVREAKSNES